MSEESFSPQALAAFERDHGEHPRTNAANHVAWLRGYDAARRDNAAAMELMQQELRKFRETGQHEEHA